MADLRTEAWTPDLVRARGPDLVPVYAQAYAEPPYHKGPAEAERFGVRLAEQAGSPGFTFHAGRVGDATVGFAFGRRFGPGEWWYGAEVLPGAEVIDAEKFAVSELVVLPACRGHGLGGRLLRTLLDGRREPYAVLLSRPGSRARDMYGRWGWRPVGTARARPDWPANDALLLDLPWRTRP